MRETTTLLIVSNAALFVLLGALGYMIRRAITHNDTRIEAAIKQSASIEQAINQLQLLIVGDYYPRKEHITYAGEVSERLEKIRADIHELRTHLQTTGNRLGILELLERQRGALDHPLQRPEPLDTRPGANHTKLPGDR